MHTYIPSPPISALHLGPLTIHMYALAIITGIVVAIWLGDRRWRERGGCRGEVADVAVWAVPFGIVGGRLYHLVTDPELYFTHGQDPWRAFAIWDGGLGIWGAVALGGVGAWIACRRHDIRLPPFADAIAPAIALAQGVGRLGNWFNQELFGAPTTLPWAVHITHSSDGSPPGFYQPTFAYELIWDIAVAALVIWADRKWKLGHGRAFALYVAAYTVGRAWVESLRIDHANHILGLRLNDWTSLLVFLAAVAYLVATRKRTREAPDEVHRRALTRVPIRDSRRSG